MGGVSKIPIENTPSVLGEVDFADFGGYAAFFTPPRYLFSFSVAFFLGAKKRGEQAAEMACGAAISNWLAATGAPGI